MYPSDFSNGILHCFIPNKGLCCDRYRLRENLLIFRRFWYYIVSPLREEQLIINCLPSWYCRNTWLILAERIDEYFLFEKEKENTITIHEKTDQKIVIIRVTSKNDDKTGNINWG
jgi:hypothetical protein